MSITFRDGSEAQLNSLESQIVDVGQTKCSILIQALSNSSRDREVLGFTTFSRMLKRQFSSKYGPEQYPNEGWRHQTYNT
jgi:hypothetical protein